MALKEYLVTKAAGVFDATGSFRPMGSFATLDSTKIGDNPKHVTEVPAGGAQLATVQVSPVAPTGPNPTMPQQVPPDAVQTLRGYEQPGARLVGEVTVDEKTRLEAAALLEDDGDKQSDVVEALEAAAADPLDHDGDGRKGGSKSGAESTRAKGAAKTA